MTKKILFSLLLIGFVSFLALPVFAEEQTGAAPEEKAAAAAPAPAEAAPAAEAPAKEEAKEAPALPKYKPSVIKAVQEALKAKNEFNGEITGELDDATVEAIKSFQKKNNLKDDGIPGPKTRIALGVESAPQPEAPAEAAPAEKAPEKTESKTQSSEQAPEQK